MSDAVDDYIPTEANEDSPPVKNLRRRPSTAACEVVPAQSSKKPRNETNTTQVRIPSNLRSVSALKKEVVKRLKGSDITKNLSLRVCKAALTLQEDYLLEKRKLSTQKKAATQPAKIREQVCQILGISSVTFSQIISNFIRDRTIYTSGQYGGGRSGNRAEKETRIPSTKAVQVSVREFVRSRRAKRQRVTGRQVLNFLLAEGIILLATDEEGNMVQCGCSVPRKRGVMSATIIRCSKGRILSPGFVICCFQI